MANFKPISEVWSPQYKQDIIDYVNELEDKLDKLTRGAAFKDRSQDGSFRSQTGRSKEQNIRLCRKMKLEGYNVAQIARYLAVSESTVQRYLRLANEELRARRGDFSRPSSRPTKQASQS